MKEIAGIIAVVLCSVAISFAAEPPPYTFGLTVVAPVMKAPLMYIPAPAGASGNLLTISTGSTNIFTVTAAGAVTALSFSGPAAGLTAIPASALSSGTLSTNVMASALKAMTEAQILATTPTVIGQKYACSDCTVTPEVISTGTTRCNDWSGTGSYQIPN